MEVLLNSKRITISESNSLLEVLETLAIPLQTTAVAVNATVIPKSDWQKTVLNTGDKIDMFQAIAGG
ncbi:sulfur carrier protein ThiS [Aliivibrio kagoshimensis]|uniref:sulfur carrier protein ThiS n=1 Tax=Aliivibrio kagoshimensis TaxID=2910230 RepID=UPI003D0C06A4